MKKSAILIMFCLTTYSTSSFSVERPSISKDMETKINGYMDDDNVNAFVCSNGDTDYTIAKKDLGMVYTSKNYYMFSNSTGISFKISKCLPAKFER